MVRDANGAVQMQGYIHRPLPGRFGEFDKLVSAYGVVMAAKLAIGFGFELLREAIDENAPLEPILDYAGEKKRSRYRQKVDPVVFAWATENLDPANVLNHNAFAGQLYKTALGLYLAKG